MTSAEGYATRELTLLVVSHDADFLDSVCTDVLHLEEFKRGHAARVRDREKEPFKKQQEDKKAGKKQHPDEVVEKIKDYVGSTAMECVVKFRFLPPPSRADDMGKSTLLNLVAKVSVPVNGDVAVASVARPVAQGLSAVDFLTSSAWPSHAHTRPMDKLSGGQKARVCFASITCRTNHLDIESVEALIDALKRYQGGFMLVSHDARLIQADLDRQVLTDLQRREEAAAKEAARRALERQKRRAGGPDWHFAESGFQLLRTAIEAMRWNMCTLRSRRPAGAGGTTAHIEPCAAKDLGPCTPGEGGTNGSVEAIYAMLHEVRREVLLELKGQHEVVNEILSRHGGHGADAKVRKVQNSALLTISKMRSPPKLTPKTSFGATGAVSAPAKAFRPVQTHTLKGMMMIEECGDSVAKSSDAMGKKGSGSENRRPGQKVETGGRGGTAAEALRADSSAP
ncbi:ABC transporter F family member 4 [Symbiodinium microadriaticum]|uniref:ABC transporter F family member 4 n=1 Tax=Symbiodinium microadriaticum TaxID=2951 RepID=A0A1Q9EPE8_SYMMI|nr:ABC transporter F family member 4 [Symbiodinium microadriaticum]